MNTVIEMKKVTKTFKMGDVDIDALKEIDVSIGKGEFIVILGPSGSGKTTLLNQIGGIDQPTSGSVSVYGQEISKYSDRELTAHRRQTIGWIFQFHNLISSLTAIENVQLALEMCGIKTDQKQIAQQALENVGLQGLEHRYPSQLSGGQQQRVAIARALAKNPTIVVADEPTGNLDRQTGSQVVQLMHELCRTKDVTFCIVTHDPSMSLVADRLFVIEDGKLYENSPDHILRYGIAEVKT